MRAKLVACQICEHWHMPIAHANHCPACGTVRIVVRGHAFYYNIQTARPVIKSGWPIVTKRLIDGSRNDSLVVRRGEELTVKPSRLA